MALEAVVEVRDLVSTITVVQDPDSVVQIVVGETTTSDSTSGGTVVEVFAPTQPSLNTYGPPIVLTSPGAIPDFACLVLVTGGGTIGLPNPGVFNDGRFIEVKNIGAAQATLNPGVIPVDGSTASITLDQWDSIRLVAYDGDWLTL